MTATPAPVLPLPAGVVINRIDEPTQHVMSGKRTLPAELHGQRGHRSSQITLTSMKGQSRKSKPSII